VNELKLMLYLYATSSCHLCEEAAALLQNLKLCWSEVDIAEDEKLMQRYSLKIPVLYRADNQTELCWPFSSSDILVFIQAK
jgi:glutaredoxin